MGSGGSLRISYFHSLRLEIFPTVYAPSEDSFMLADYALTAEGKILDMGCGCGIASLAAASAGKGNKVTGADINPAAVLCSQRNARINKIKNCNFLVSDLFGSLPQDEDYDCIMFNYPYLPTAKKQRLSDRWENAAYDGGRSGLSVLKKFALQAPNYLAPKGKVAVVSSSLGGGIEKAIKVLEEKIGEAKILRQQEFFFEKIALIEASRG